jgi:hypothetical protein
MGRPWNHSYETETHQIPMLHASILDQQKMVQRANVLEHSLENHETVECISQFAMLPRICNRQSPQALVDSLLSHVDARWQLVPVEFHCRRFI